MKITYDNTSDSMYIYLKKTNPIKTIELASNLIADLDNLGNIIGLEIISVSKMLTKETMSLFKQKQKGLIPLTITK